MRPPAVWLCSGEWLRWQVNYRFSVPRSDWSYRLETLDLAYGPADAVVFLGIPTHRVDERAVAMTDRRAAAANGHVFHLVDVFTGRPFSEVRVAEFAHALNLCAADLSPGLTPAVVSTGLRYLVMPIESGLEHARITRPDFEELLATVGAEFVYVVDVAAMEGRHWNNDGRTEDVATGSGAGTVAAYLVRNRRVPANRPFVLRQGRFAGRPSEITLTGEGTAEDIRSIRVAGQVVAVGHGRLDAVPIGPA